jgi:hypothetical protein
VKCEKCSHFFVVMNEQDQKAKAKDAKVSAYLGGYRRFLF